MQFLKAQLTNKPKIMTNISDCLSTIDKAWNKDTCRQTYSQTW